MSRTEACEVELSESLAGRCNEDFQGDDEAEEEDITHLSATTGSSTRGRRRVKAERQPDDAPSPSHLPDPCADNELPSKRDVWVLGGVFFLSVIVALHFIMSWMTQEGKPWRWGCRQCQQDWWRDFWRWRLEVTQNSGDVGNGLEVNKAPPPPGMDWNWGANSNNTDWWVASDELVSKVVLPHVDTSLGPVLQIGCGDSPLAAVLYRAGFQNSEHIDIEPRVIQALQKRYLEVEWPGMRFEVRDFLESTSAGGGAPPPLNRFAAVVDKAGIWDWLVEEKPSVLPRLLAAVSDALVLAPRPGVYVVATKQKPSDMQDMLAKYGANGFAVDVARPLLSSTSVGASAWAYVLIPV